MSNISNGLSPRKKTSGFIKFWKSQNGQKILIIMLFSCVPLVLLILFTYLPFGRMIQFSFYDMKYLGRQEYVGFKNYQDVFSREEIFGSLTRSFYYIGASIVQLALALYFATLLSFRTKGGNFFKGVLFFPFLVCGIAVGYIFKFFFTRGFVFDSILGWVGFSLDSLPYWLRDSWVNNIALAGTSVWRYMGQNMVLFIGAIQSVDPQLYEAAEIDGANRWHQFIHIILPSIMTIVVLNLILSISGSLSAFEPPFVITKGTFGTDTFFLMMHKIAHDFEKVGLASAMAIVLFAMIIAVTIIQKMISKALTDDVNSDYGRKTMKRLKKRLKEAKA